MKNRFFLSLTTALILSLGLMTTITFAQKHKGNETDRKEPVPTKPRPSLVTMKCAPSKSDVAVQVLVTNNTGQTIPQGTKITAKQAGLSGWTTLSQALAANEDVKFTLGGNWTDAKPCTAYYTKQ